MTGAQEQGIVGRSGSAEVEEQRTNISRLIFSGVGCCCAFVGGVWFSVQIQFGRVVVERAVVNCEIHDCFEVFPDGRDRNTEGISLELGMIFKR